MKYTTKIAIIPFDRYERLMESNTNGEPVTLIKEDMNSEDKKLVETGGEEIIEDSDQQKDSMMYNVLSNIPKHLKKKATLLLNYLDTIDNIKWDTTGKLIINGKLLEGSHIVDLVRNAIVKSSRFEPVGSDEFYSNLKNIPLSLIVNEKRLQQLKPQQQAEPIMSNNDVLIGGSINNSQPPGIPNRKEKSLREYFESKSQPSSKKWQKYKN